MNLATVILLGILVTSLLVILQFDEKASFNKLTLLPYYLVLCYSVLGFLQQTFSFLFPAEAGIDESPLYLLNIAKVWFMFAAINFQSYEWINAWLIIDF